MIKILITGTSGFIGRKLSEKLKKINEIIGFNRAVSGIKNIKEINDDIVNISKYQKKLKGVRQVYHLVALINFHPKSLKESFRVNVLGTKKLLETCRKIKIKKFLFVSAGATLGFAKTKNDLIDESTDYMPPRSNPYAWSKYLAEKEVLNYAKYFQTVIVNPSTVYGDGDHRSNSTSIVKMVASGKLKIFFPGGTSYIDVDDLIEGLELAMNLGRHKNRYILSTENLTYKDLINRIAKVLNKEGIKFCFPEFTYFPLSVGIKLFELIFPDQKFINSNIFEGFYHYRYFKTTKAKEYLGFKPKFKIEDSVKKILREWQNQISY